MNKHKIFLLALILVALPMLGLSCGNKKNQDAGVYKSTDGGETWEQKVKIDDKNSIAGLSINEVVVDNYNSQVVLVGAEGNGIYKTTNGGDSWQATSLGFGKIYSIEFNPNDSSVVYAAGQVGELAKMFKSSDGGSNWEEIYSETAGDTWVNDITVDWYDPRRLYAGTSFGVLLKSTDSGRSWVAIRWFDDESVVRVAVSYNDSRQLMVATDSSIYRSTDGGEVITDIEEKVESIGNIRNIHDLVAHPKAKQNVYLIGEIGLLVSPNWGDNWLKINTLANPDLRTVNDIALDPSDDKKIYFTFDSNFYKTTDNGDNWSVKQFTSGKLQSITIDPNDTSVIYATVLANTQQ